MVAVFSGDIHPIENVFELVVTVLLHAESPIAHFIHRLLSGADSVTKI